MRHRDVVKKSPSHFHTHMSQYRTSMLRILKSHQSRCLKTLRMPLLLRHNHSCRNFSSTMTAHKEKAEQPLTQPPEDTIFAKMARGEIKVTPVYEDEHCMAINDINPAAPVHILIISKKLNIGQVHQANDNDSAELGQLLIAAGKIAKDQGLTSGYRLVVNQGVNALQTVNYLHIHMLAGKENMSWPPC